MTGEKGGAAGGMGSVESNALDVEDIELVSCSQRGDNSSTNRSSPKNLHQSFEGVAIDI
jgi:hypothetical protein